MIAWNDTSFCTFTDLFFNLNLSNQCFCSLTKVSKFDLPKPHKCVAMVCNHWVLCIIISVSCSFQLKPTAWNQFLIIGQLQQNEADLKICQLLLWVTEITSLGDYHHDLVKQLISYPIINPSGLGGVLLRVITYFFGLALQINLCSHFWLCSSKQERQRNNSFHHSVGKVYSWLTQSWHPQTFHGPKKSFRDWVTTQKFLLLMSF